MNNINKEHNIGKRISGIKENTDQNAEFSKDEHNGKYEWTNDFIFTNDVINDIKNKKMLEVGPRVIQVMLPVNRENAPTKHNTGDGYIGKDGTVEKWNNNDNSFEKSVVSRDDLEPYDILHIELIVDFDNKNILIDRYYGHRKDWTVEGHDQGNRDWSETPVLTSKTVDSIMEAYNSRGVFEKIEKEISSNENGNTPHWWESGKFNRRNLESMKRFCQEFKSGSINDYEYVFIEPSVPNGEYDKKKMEDHERVRKLISWEINRYQSTHEKTGD